jgi:hypothetical protein
MLTPRAADDFAIIRGRLEELRRERAQAPPETGDQAGPTEAEPGAASGKRETRERRLPRVVHQRLFGQRLVG